MMRIEIVIEESDNGFRVDILDFDAEKPIKENLETELELWTRVKRFVDGRQELAAEMINTAWR